jgi:superfamily II DNA or RNA helicase
MVSLAKDAGDATLSEEEKASRLHAPLPLRPYQVRDVGKLHAATAEGGNPLYVLPTGGGKTVVIAALAAKWEAEGKRSLIIAHRREIVQQTENTLLKFGVTPRVIAAGTAVVGGDDESDASCLTTLAMIPTLARRCAKHLKKKSSDGHDGRPYFDPPIDFVVVDEAHHAVASSYGATLESACSEAKLVGVTATPYRTDGKGLSRSGFDRIVKGPSISELIKAGFLVQPRLVVQKFIDTKDVAITRGDYDLAELSEKARAATQSIVDHFLDRAVLPSDNKSSGGGGGGKAKPLEVRKALFFAVDVTHSKDLHDELVRRGVRAEHIDAKTPVAERDEILAAFRNGSVQALTNCMIATEGFDAPQCSAVVLCRPTLSRTLYMQMVGRGLRSSLGKKDCLFLDCSKLVEAHGLPTDPTHFSLEDGLIEVEKTGIMEFMYRQYGINEDKHLVETLKNMTAFRYFQLELSRVGEKKLHESDMEQFELKGTDGMFKFDGFVFETAHTFPEEVIGMLVANRDAEGATGVFDAALYDGRQKYLGEYGLNPTVFLQNLVRLIADFSDEELYNHFSNLRRIAEEKKYKEGWVYYRLKAQWGLGALDKLRYNYGKWCRRQDKNPHLFKRSAPVKAVKVLALPTQKLWPHFPAAPF